MISLQKQCFQNFEVIIVDNGSSDKTKEIISSLNESVLFQLTTVNLEENRGFTGGNIEGLAHCKGQLIALLNPDTVADSKWLEGLTRAMDMHPEAGICASKMVVHGTDRIDSAGDIYSKALKGFKRGEGEDENTYNIPEHVFGASAGAALYRRSMIDEIGFLDDDFFLIQEDTDLNFRAQLAGWKVLFVPSAVVYHKVRSSIGHMSDTAIYYTLRNTEFVRIKNVPLGIAMKCLPSFVIGMLAEFVYFVIKHKKINLYFKAKKDALIKVPLMWNKRRIIMKQRKTTNKYIVSIMSSVFDKEFTKAKLAKLFYG